MQNGMKKANAILEYGLILFVAVSALIAMRPFIKRTIQARVKDLTDDYIGSGEKGSSVDPPPRSGKTSKASHRNFSADYIFTEDYGGQMNVSSNSQSNWDSEETQGVSDIIDYAKKPPEILYPNAEYIEWAQKWNLIQ